ncbi:hypothetical protein ZWY2020_054749 [Hordeum vulgare]|nr:hypothetical protein ZWY2020_054749 [Hordeum vulgare]
MPTVVAAAATPGADSSCAVCKEASTGDKAGDARSHMYHQTASCHGFAATAVRAATKLPTDVPSARQVTGAADDCGSNRAVVAAEERRRWLDDLAASEEALPLRGFLVVRGGERELVVYTEVDGGFNNGGAPRRISWSSRGSRSSQRGIVTRMFDNMFACFGHAHSTNAARASSSRSEWSSVFT